MTKTFGNFTDLMDFSRSSGGTALRKVSYGSELVTNGTFDSDTTGWTAGGSATLSVVSNKLRVTNGAASYGYAYQAVSTVVGRIYTVSIDVTAGTSEGFVRVATPSFTDVIYQSGSVPTGNLTVNFVAKTTTTWVRVGNITDTSGQYCDFDNISVKEVTLDSGSDDPVLFNHPADTPRIEYDTDGTVKGLLIEEARTNLIEYSVVDDTPYWDLISQGTGSVPVRTINHATAPDGTTTAARLQCDLNGGTTSSDRSYLSNDAITGTAGLDYTFSVWLKSADGNPYDIHISISGAEAKVVTVTNEWQRFSTKLTYSTFTMRSRIGLIGSQGTSDTADILVWGAQLEQGSFATSYIPTFDATATRSADIASIAVENFGYNQDEGTVVVDGSSFATTAFPYFANLGTDSTNRIWVYQGAEIGTIYTGAEVDDVNQFIVQSSEVSDKIGITFSENYFATAVGGVLAGTDTSGQVPAVTSIDLGGRTATTFKLNGHIKSIQYYPRRLTNRQLQELTGATNTYDYTTVEAGTITRSPVATGSDLVAYSGFNTTNYLEQPYNSDLDFGTGDFCVMGWVKHEGSDNTIFYYGNSTFTDTPSQSNFYLWTNAGKFKFRANNAYIETGDLGITSRWSQFSVTRSGNTVYIYVDGKLITSVSASSINISGDPATDILAIGSAYYKNQNGNNALALLRISATAPTAEQIAKIYEDEKVLFQDGAQATLYGSSDAVTALAHDDVTNLLHVGTSAGRSVFQGLRRVENTTDAVGAAISASNGLVVEE
jgi:hypothetical protein